MSSVARRYYVRALEEARRGDLEAAREDFRAAMELVPDFVEARIAYATALARSGEGLRAADLIRDGLQVETRRRPRMLLDSALGDVLIAAGDYRGAEECFVRASQAEEGFGIRQAHLHDRLARVRAKTGRFKEAFEELLAAAQASREPGQP